MKKISILEVISSASLAMAFSLALVACGDDSSSGPAPVTGGDESSSSTEISSSAENVESSSSENPASSGNSAGSSSSVAPGSSATVPESSAAEESSSSEQGRLSQVAEKISGTCMANSDPYDREADASCPEGAVCQMPMKEEWALPPVAYMSVESGKATFVVERAFMPCESISGTTGIVEKPPLSEIIVSVSGDTLYVNAGVKEAFVDQRCTCPSRLVFTIDAEDAFTAASLLVVDDEQNRFNRMTIVKDDEI